jgi:glycosyltransferase involved in cell wall biosynthesis
MKIAIISDLYPPAFIGGYEMGMSWIVSDLRRRGSDVDVFHCREFYVVTGSARRDYIHPKRGFENIDIGPGITGALSTFLRRRPLRLGWFVIVYLKSLRNHKRFREKLKTGNYDLILIGNPLGFLTPICDTASRQARSSCKTRIGLLISDAWVAGWPGAFPLHQFLRPISHSPSALRSKGKRAALKFLRSHLLRWFINRRHHSFSGVESWFLDFAVCVSKYIKSISEKRISAPAVVDVAHWGLPFGGLPPIGVRPNFSAITLRLVYVGQIEPHKGLMTLLAAMNQTKNQHSLTVIGDDTTAYAASCRNYIEQCGLLEAVSFTGKLPQAGVYQMLLECHILIVPSEWEEPYAIVPLQGKYCGLVTIVSNTGGSSEGIVDGEDGFLFERANSLELAEILGRLHRDRELCERVSATAQRRMLEGGDISHMVDKILRIANVE